MRVLLLMAVSSLGGWILGTLKRRPQPGFWLGLLLGPLGWVLILLSPRKTLPCPGCARPMAENAKSCPHCGRLFLEVSYRVSSSSPVP